VTAVLDATSETTPADTAPEVPAASWPARAGAFSLDVCPGLAVVATMALLTLTAPLFGWVWWVFTAAAAATVVVSAVNRWLLPSMTGWSLGRAVAGIRVVRRDGTPAGLGRLLLRDLAHLVDTAALLIGWLWPLWDKRSRTFADLLLRTEVHTVTRPERDVRRTAGKVLCAAVLVCALAVGWSYLTVYRQEQAVAEARQQIAEQGPRIVEQMLSYSADSLKDDFAHAQSLTTEAFRPRLIADQQTAQKAGPSSTEYWAVSSAVLSAAKDRAAMLLAMQGQRGANANDLKFITATVRVDFVKVGDDWRVDDLTVLKRPLMHGGGQ
jgi:Mce-associated membrane protein